MSLPNSPIPAPPVPPMRRSVRDILYGVWAWLGVIVVTAAAAWSVFGSLPTWYLALALGHTAFGTYAGFLAKDNVR